jgi:hypothetical protein
MISHTVPVYHHQIEAGMIFRVSVKFNHTFSICFGTTAIVEVYTVYGVSHVLGRNSTSGKILSPHFLPLVL